MTNDEIKALLYPDSYGRSVKGDPDWPSIHERLQVGKRLNLQYLWEEYKEENTNGLSYSRFCYRYLDWKNETGKNVIMVQNREPGKELFVDWMKCKEVYEIIISEVALSYDHGGSILSHTWCFR